MLFPFQTQLEFLKQNRQYRGRFAPSPSGPLHFGSLIAALASFLQAKSNNGLWFVRIEDIDKPRERIGAVEQILTGLTAFGMQWDNDQLNANYVSPEDNDCLVQSKRLSRYQQILNFLQKHHCVYACQCTRKQIKQTGGLYQGHCRNKSFPFDNNAIRVHLANPVNQFEDALFGTVVSDSNISAEDFIIKRRDDLFAYQFVVVIDDIDQGISEVVRGADIMPLTTRQIGLYKLFGISPPDYLHIPLAVQEIGYKLSKQNHAQAIDITNPIPELIAALSFLGLPTSQILNCANTNVPDIIQWAINNWSVAHLPKQQEIII